MVSLRELEITASSRLGYWLKKIKKFPELQKRDAYPSDYTPGTLRNKLHGRGDKLPAEHKGASFSYRERVATA